MIAPSRFALGEGSVASCPRCVRTGAGVIPYDDLADRLAAAAAAAPHGRLILDGPEPLAHPELPRIVRAAVGAGAVRLGIAIGRTGSAANARGALSAGVRGLELGLGPGAPVDELVEDVAAWRSAAQALAVDLAVTARIAVCRHTLASLPTLAAASARLGAVVVTFAASPLDDHAAETGGWLRAACDTATVNGVWADLEGLAPALLDDVTRRHAARAGDR